MTSAPGATPTGAPSARLRPPTPAMRCATPSTGSSPRANPTAAATTARPPATGGPTRRWRWPATPSGDRPEAALPAVAELVEILAEIEVDLLDDVDHQLLKVLGRQPEPLADRAQLGVLGEVDLAVRGVDRRDELDQTLLQLLGIAGERCQGLGAVELLGVELVDPEIEVHRQRLHIEDLPEETLDRHLLLAFQVVVREGGVHEQV